MLLGAISALSLVSGLAVCFGAGAFGGLSWLWLLPLTFLGTFLILTGIGFAFLLILCRRVDQSVPQEQDDRLYRIVTELVIESALPFLRIHVKKTGVEKIPTDGRFLLVANHTNDSDPIILLYALPKRQLAFISKRENSSMFVIGPMMHKIQCQLINRENDREALKTILRCIQIIKEDKPSIAVFPEGGIDDDGLLHHFKPGVFKIAQKANVPVVVCTLKNTKEVVHNIKHLKPSRVELNVLEVIPAEEIKAAGTVEIAHRCHDLMAADLGPELTAED